MISEDYKKNVSEYVTDFIPEQFRSACFNYLMAYPGIREIRLRLNGPVSFTLPESNLVTGMICTKDDIGFTVNRMTDGSYFKYEEIMRSGYLPLDYGIRCGIGGEVYTEKSDIKVLKNVSYVNIRIPFTFLTDTTELTDLIKRSQYRCSVLVFSPPCTGKTTVVRSAAYSLSSGAHKKRVCAVDTNYELQLPYSSEPSLCEYLTGYPKAKGIEIAVRYMNPEYIVCDEIGTSGESEAICQTQHCGVPLIATVHASTFDDVKRRKNILSLLENNVFDYAMRIVKEGRNFRYEIKSILQI